MNRLRFSVLFAAIVALLAPGFASGHGGQIKVAGGARGPVTLNAAQMKALDLRTVPADVRPIARLLAVNGQVVARPDAAADVGLRISGSVVAVAVNAGDLVRKGQLLARVQARVYGNPPPTISIVAPIAGVIDVRNVVVGQSVEPNSVLFHMSDHRRLQIVAKVYEEDLGKVQRGQRAFVKLLGYPDELFTAVVQHLGPALDPETRTLDVWLQLDNPRGLLRPNLFARADLVLAMNAEALAVPNAAVLEANGEKFVFVREGSRFDRVVVALGARDDQFSAVTSQLVPGDEVVTQGARAIYTLWLAGGQLSAADED